jgi:hypothetical protein
MFHCIVLRMLFHFSCPQMRFLIYCFCGFLFLCAQARSEPLLRVVEDAGRSYESL